MNSQTLHAALAILRTDIQRMVRDRFMVGMSAYLLLLCSSMRWLIPWIESGVQSRWQVDLVPYEPLMISYIAILMACVMVGIIGGFLVLEAREEKTIKAVLVTPLPLAHYFAILVAAHTLLAFSFAVFEAFLINIDLPSILAVVACCLAVSPFAALSSFFLATAADNKVEAFAQAKFLSLAALIPVGAWFIPEPVQYLFGLFPPYWGIKAYWLACLGQTNWFLWLLPSVPINAVWLWGFYRWFSRAAHR